MTVDFSRIFRDENEGWVSRTLGRFGVARSGSGREVTQLAHRFVDLINIGEFPNVVEPLFERFCTQFAARAQLPEVETGRLMKQWLRHETQGSFPFQRFFPAIDRRFGSCDPLPALEAPVAASGRARAIVWTLAALALGATALYLAYPPAALSAVALQVCENTAAQCAAPAALSTVSAAAEVWTPPLRSMGGTLERTMGECALTLCAGIAGLLRRRMRDPVPPVMRDPAPPVMRDPVPPVQSKRSNLEFLGLALDESIARTKLILDEKEAREQLLQNSRT